MLWVHISNRTLSQTREFFARVVRRALHINVIIFENAFLMLCKPQEKNAGKYGFAYYFIVWIIQEPNVHKCGRKFRFRVSITWKWGRGLLTKSEVQKNFCQVQYQRSIIHSASTFFLNLAQASKVKEKIGKTTKKRL